MGARRAVMRTAHRDAGAFIAARLRIHAGLIRSTSLLVATRPCSTVFMSVRLLAPGTCLKRAPPGRLAGRCSSLF